MICSEVLSCELYRPKPSDNTNYRRTFAVSSRCCVSKLVRRMKVTYVVFICGLSDVLINEYLLLLLLLLLFFFFIPLVVKIPRVKNES